MGARSKQGQGCWFLLLFFLSVFRKPSPDPVSYVVSYKALKQVSDRAEPDCSELLEPRAEQPPSIERKPTGVPLSTFNCICVAGRFYILKIQKNRRKPQDSHP